MKRRPVILGMLVVAAACSPFGSAAVTGATDDGGLTDGGRQDPGADVDASSLDGAPDALSACAAGNHFFCEDFDGPLPWAGWTVVDRPSSPLIADTQVFVSPPASLHVTVQPSTETDHPSFLHRPLPAAQRIVVTADVLVSRSTSPVPDGEVDVIALELTPAPAGFDRYFVTIVANSAGSWVLEAVMNPKSGSDLFTQTPLGQLGPTFTQARLDLDLAQGRVTASVGGGTPGIISLDTAIGLGARLEVGATWASNSTGTFSVNVDNLIVDQ